MTHICCLFCTQQTYSVQFINEKFGLNISFRLNEDEVVDNSTTGEMEEFEDGYSGNAPEENDSGNTASENEHSVSGDERQLSNPLPEDSGHGNGSPDVADSSG